MVCVPLTKEDAISLSLSLDPKDEGRCITVWAIYIYIYSMFYINI